MIGKVLHIHRKLKKPGEFGLLKPKVVQARITHNGIEGDYNDFRATKKNNDPDMALLLMPIEIINELNQEGWPVKAGDIGENIVTKGIRLNAFEKDKKLNIGSAKVQLSFECDPCYKLHSLPYIGKELGPEFIKTMIGRRGWYARVLETGNINVGDICSFSEVA